METRPIFLEVLRIRLPAMAVTSFLHRVSGVLLFLAIPLGLWLLQRSLAGEGGFSEVKAFFEGGLGSLLGIAVVWALAHHFLAGLRFLLMDVGFGHTLQAARRSAWAVNLAAPLIALGFWL